MKKSKFIKGQRVLIKSIIDIYHVGYVKAIIYEKAKKKYAYQIYLYEFTDSRWFYEEFIENYIIKFPTPLNLILDNIKSDWIYCNWIPETKVLSATQAQLAYFYNFYKKELAYHGRLRNYNPPK